MFLTFTNLGSTNDVRMNGLLAESNCTNPAEVYGFYPKEALRSAYISLLLSSSYDPNTKLNIPEYISETNTLSVDSIKDCFVIPIPPDHDDVILTFGAENNTRFDIPKPRFSFRVVRSPVTCIPDNGWRLSQTTPEEPNSIWHLLTLSDDLGAHEVVWINPIKFIVGNNTNLFVSSVLNVRREGLEEEGFVFDLIFFKSTNRSPYSAIRQPISSNVSSIIPMQTNVPISRDVK